jgi:hypothetical protein
MHVDDQMMKLFRDADQGLWDVVDMYRVDTHGGCFAMTCTVAARYTDSRRVITYYAFVNTVLTHINSLYNRLGPITLRMYMCQGPVLWR